MSVIDNVSISLLLLCIDNVSIRLHVIIEIYSRSVVSNVRFFESIVHIDTGINVSSTLPCGSY